MTPRKKPKKKTVPEPKEKRGPGRPTGKYVGMFGFKPTPEQRKMVEMAAMYRIPEDEIVKVVINPKTGEPISPVTLRKHFRKELNQSFMEGRVRLMAATFRNALGETVKQSDGTEKVVKEGNVTAQIWLGKVLYGLREMDPPPPPPPAPIGRGELPGCSPSARLHASPRCPDGPKRATQTQEAGSQVLIL